MTNTTSKSRISLTLGMVLLVVSAAFAGGAGAAGTATIDEETSTTSYESEIKSNTVVDNVTGNLSTKQVVTAKTDTNDTKAVLKEENESYDAAVNDTGENVDHNVSGSEMNWLNYTFTHDQLLDVEHKPGENVTMQAVIYNNTSMSDSDQATGNVTWYAVFNNDTSTETITDNDVEDEDIVETFDESEWFNLSVTDKSRIEAEDREVPEETMYIAATNDTVSDDMSDVLDEFDSEESASSVLSFRGPNGLVKVTDGDKTVYVPVFVEDTPDDTDGMYAVLTDDVGGSTGLEIHNPTEEFDAGDDVDVTAAFGTGTEGFAFGYLSQSIESLSMTILGGVSGSALAFAPVAAVRRRDQRAALEG